MMQKFEQIEISEERAKQLGTTEVWGNDTHQVIVYRDPKKAPELPQNPDPKDWPNMIWLSIKRVDREAMHDWRELQEIKNMIVGPENEAVEVYPAESRLVDTSNQYHLWVFADTETRFPFGFTSRGVIDHEVADKIFGAKQRPFKSASSISVEEIINYIENDAEVAIPIDKFLNDKGEHLTKKEYGKILIETLCQELKDKYLK